MRYFFQVCYQGGNYHGWQIQKNAVTVQQVINDTLSTFFGQTIETLGSGRTDTGVHATHQIFHADIDGLQNLSDLKFKLNSFLPPDIGIIDIYPVNQNANARFDAVSRAYVYKIHQRKDPFLKNFSYFFRNSVDLKAMNEAANMLIGEKDFESFSKVKTAVNHFRCHVTMAKWEMSEHQLFFHIAANRFLRGMVRAVVGTLLDVGTGKSNPADVTLILAAKDRNCAGRSAPAEGLYLCQVDYPKDIYRNI